MRDAQQKDHARWRRAKYRKPEDRTLIKEERRCCQRLNKCRSKTIWSLAIDAMQVHGSIAVMHVMHAAFVVSAVCQPIHLFHTPVPMSPSFSFWFLTSTVAVEPKTVAVQRNVRERIFPPFAFGVEPQMLQPGSGATVGGGGSQTA